MAVGEDGGIEAGDAGAEGLGTEIGGGVDDDTEVFTFEPSRGAEAPIPGVGRGADAAVAGEHGDALGSAGAEEGQSHEMVSVG